ncbi:MAG: endonuclease/exonuclease/phosphatase family protein [Candidatus Promineifilaceae bacterium]
MLVELPAAIVVGPTHDGCGFEVVRRDSGVNHIHHEFDSDLAGYVVSVLHPSDVECDNIPSVNAGDMIFSLMGPLTYHFDKYKIVYQDSGDLKIKPIYPTIDWQLPPLTEDQISVASFNLNDYFYDSSQATESNEATEYSADLNLRREKISYIIGQLLRCPTIIGIQEIENKRLLLDLAEMLEKPCGFLYQVSHIDSPDTRGSDVALMTDTRRVNVEDIALNQECTALRTDVIDPHAGCSENTYPLYSRPPLSAQLIVDGERFFVLVNHFKSKRGGAAETAPVREYQATHLARLVNSMAENNGPIPTVVMGDFNDYARSPSLNILTRDGELVDILRNVPETQRYTYIFDGEQQLIDWILVSPVLARRVASANILHVNADYSNALRFDLTPEGLPFRSSDHDIPLVVLASAGSDGDLLPSLALSNEEQGSISRSVEPGKIELPEEFKTAYRSVFLVSLIAVSAGLEVLSIMIGKHS